MNRVFDRVWNDNMIVKIPEPIVIQIPEPIELPDRTAVIEYELRQDVVNVDQFRCLVCLEHVSDVTKCPKCSAMYCDPCYERC